MKEAATLNNRQLRAIEALLREPTTRAAATAAGVSEKTLWRWLSDPVFAAVYRSARSQLLEGTFTALQAASTEAVETLRAVMNNPETGASARVSAARTVIEFSLRTREELEIERRLRALESADAARMRERIG